LVKAEVFGKRAPGKRIFLHKLGCDAAPSLVLCILQSAFPIRAFSVASGKIRKGGIKSVAVLGYNDRVVKGHTESPSFRRCPDNRGETRGFSAVIFQGAEVSDESSIAERTAGKKRSRQGTVFGRTGRK
jgi:hypothetical protein